MSLFPGVTFFVLCYFIRALITFSQHFMDLVLWTVKTYLRYCLYIWIIFCQSWIYSHQFVQWLAMWWVGAFHWPLVHGLPWWTRPMDYLNGLLMYYLNYPTLKFVANTNLMMMEPEQLIYICHKFQGGPFRVVHLSSPWTRSIQGPGPLGSPLTSSWGNEPTPMWQSPDCKLLLWFQLLNVQVFGVSPLLIKVKF